MEKGSGARVTVLNGDSIDTRLDLRDLSVIIVCFKGSIGPLTGELVS